MDAKVSWVKELQFKGVSTSGFVVPMDSHASPETGTGPMEMVAMALAGCTAMDVISILTKKRQKVTAFEVKAHGEQADEHPRALTRFLVEYVVTGKEIDRDAVQRAVELSQEKYCSVSATLRKAGPIETKITINEG